MTSKANIFNSLPQHQSDSEGEEQNTRVKRPNEKRDAKTGNKKTTGDNLAHKANKEEHSRTKETRPQKGVTGEPHPLDRHSGTGHAAYGGKPKKGGSGKGNWGSDKRPAETRGEEVEREGEEETQEPQEEEKPALTLQEYYAKRGNTSAQTQVNEAKAKITSEQLYKEMGTATLLKTRQQSNVDDHKVGKKKDHLDVDHHAGVTTEHAGLLNFRTGFVEKEYKQRERGDETGPRKFAPRTQKKTEEVKEETQPATQPAEGEAQPVTEGQTAPEGVAEGQDNRRRQDGQRGNGRGGYKGERPQGGRKPYAGTGKPQQAKVDFADESAFPKLG